jgi:hypothetical protein
MPVIAARAVSSSGSRSIETILSRSDAVRSCGYHPSILAAQKLDSYRHDCKWAERCCTHSAMTPFNVGFDAGRCPSRKHRRRAALPLARILFVLSCTAASGALAFEGEIEVEYRIDRKAGGEQSIQRRTILVSPLGIRSDLLMGNAKERTFSLRLAKRPGVQLVVNPERRTYTESPNATGGREREKFGVVSRRDEKLKGFRCTHVVLLAASGTRVERWVTNDSDDLGRIVAAAPLITDAASGRSKDEKGIDGFPLKTVVIRPNGVRSVVEVKRIRRHPVPPARFDLTGFAKVDRDADEDGGSTVRRGVDPKLPPDGETK